MTKELDAPHILIVEDDRRTRDLLKVYLQRKGYWCSGAEDTSQAECLLGFFKFDLIIMDVMLPGMDGVEFTSQLRLTNDIPVIILSAKGDIDRNRIDGLTAGADDYVPKPFNPEEIVVRINNILRRVPSRKKDSIRLGQLEYDIDHGELHREGVRIQLTGAEIRFLNLLAGRANLVVSREMLGAASGSESARVAERSVDITVFRLRRKIEEDPRNPRYLKTVRGEGYMLVPDPAGAANS